MHFRHTVRCVASWERPHKGISQDYLTAVRLNTVRLFRLTAFGGRIMHSAKARKRRNLSKPIHRNNCQQFSKFCRHDSGLCRMEREHMTRLVLGLLRPYRGWLAIVFIAMLVEIATSLAAPWPLKLVLDDALGKHHLPHWLAWAHDYGFGRHTLGVALFAGVATLVIAVIGAI